ncbi:RNA-polymerase beta-subunit [Bacillus phage vB_BpuM-BpSp]|nr:RNA-polymerase beta-subunit [Bacillus phage vB_BpuM-BpSp]
MHYLDSLSELKVLSKKPIYAITKSKSDRSSNMIFLIGNKRENISELLSTKIIHPTTFKAVYVPRMFTSIYKGKRIYVDQKAYYDYIQKNATNNITMMKRSIPDYNKYNLIYDITDQWLENEAEIPSRGKRRIELFIQYLIEKVNEGSKTVYPNKAILVPIPDTITDSSFADLNKVDNPFAYLYAAIKRKLLSNSDIEALKGISLVFYTPVKESIVTIKIDEKINDLQKINRFAGAIRNLINIANQNTSKGGDGSKFPSSEEESEGSNSELTPDSNDEVVNKVKEKLLSKLDIDENTKLSKNTTEAIEKLTDDIKETLSKEVDIENKSEEELIELLNKYKNIKIDLKTVSDLQVVGGDEVKENKVLERLKSLQSKVELDGENIQDIIDGFKASSIDTEIIENVNVIMDETRKSNLKDFDLSYYNKQMKRDLVSVLSSFNRDSDIKLYITNIESENTSDDLTKRITYSVTFQDENNTRHSIKFDYPIMQEGRFMRINGGKKLILKQIFLLPIVKTKPDTVQVTTNYNKFIITRFGSKISQKTERIKKFFRTKDREELKVKDDKFKYKLGNALSINASSKTTLEYNEFSSFLLEITTSNGTLIFDQNEINKTISSDLDSIKKLREIKESNSKYNTEDYLIIGFNSDKTNLIGIKYDNKKVYSLDKENANPLAPNLTELVLSYIVKAYGNEGYDILKKFSDTKTLAYTRVKINNKTIPIGVLLGYEIGLTKLLERYDIEYRFETKAVKMGLSNYNRIKFKNGYLYYDNSKIRNSLLLSGLSVIATEMYDFEEFDEIDPYIETFNELYGSRNVGKGFHNTISLMVDPITLDVLKQLKLPEHIYDILLYANTLLEDSTHTKLNDMSSYRVRGAEQVNAYLYKILADSFKTYKDTLKAGNPIKLSVPRDILIKQLLESPTVDEYSVLNPSLNNSGALNLF